MCLIAIFFSLLISVITNQPKAKGEGLNIYLKGFRVVLKQIEQILNDKVRPQLALHGGDIQSISCEEGIYRFKLLGKCSGCPSAYLTTENLIREELMSSLSGLTDVVLIQGISDSLLEEARNLMGKRHA